MFTALYIKSQHCAPCAFPACHSVQVFAWLNAAILSAMRNAILDVFYRRNFNCDNAAQIISCPWILVVLPPISLSFLGNFAKSNLVAHRPSLEILKNANDMPKYSRLVIFVGVGDYCVCLVVVTAFKGN